MYIYKITVIPLNQVYIGLDTKPPYKQSRWKEHCRAAFKGSKKRKLHDAMRKYGIENCRFEIIEEGFNNIGALALSEINYIKKYDSFRNGLNSTSGGDGLGNSDLSTLNEAELAAIRSALGESLTEYNKKKWGGTSFNDRQLMMQHLYTADVSAKKSETLKKYYNHNPTARKDKGKHISMWQKNNRDLMIQNCRINGAKGAAKVSKKLKVEMPDGSMLYFQSKSEFQRKTGQWAKTILDKTNQGIAFNGYKAWEV